MWNVDIEQLAKEFVNGDPDFGLVRSIYADFDETRERIKRIPQTKDVEPFRYETNQLKTILFDRIRQFELIFGNSIRFHYRKKYFSMNDFLTKNEARLNRQLRDLDDVRFVMNTIDTFKENFVEIDQTIEPLEVRKSTFNCFIHSDERIR